ncbi:MAG: universal stress protein [Deltaproteobacteria bacterium]|nr:universal stress protein [Deltaproteobacteria bacterium]
MPIFLGGTVQKILICTDGTDLGRKAEDMALALASRFQAHLTGLYVVDPFLKKFTHEIYAINREACRDHLDKLLRHEGEQALASLQARCASAGLAFIPKIRQGPPEEEILNEIQEGGYDLLIMGAKLLQSWRERLESVNLPKKIFSQAPISMLFVR